MATRLEWTVAAGDAVSFEAATAIAAPAPSARLPTAVELVESLVGDPAAFPFGVSGAVWAADGGRIDPTSDEIQQAGPAPADATANLVWVTEAAAQRPAAPQKRSLQVLGYMDDAVFQQCTEAATHLNAEYGDEYSIVVDTCMGFEYEKKREGIAAAVSNEDVKSMRVVVYDAQAKTVTTGDDFIAHVTANTSFRLFDLPAEDPQSYQNLARASLRKHLASTGSKFAWMLVKINDQVAGRIVFQLFADVCPKTCLNFIHLCRGDLPDVKDGDSTIKLSYKGSRFYRTVKGGWVQGGDITGKKAGNGGWSIYGSAFPDESFDVVHDDAGILGMCNDGEHTNSSSFYVTVKRMPWMDKRYVAFGRVVEGLHVVRAIHDTEVRHNQTPQVDIVIDDCGDVPLDG